MYTYILNIIMYIYTCILYKYRGRLVRHFFGQKSDTKSQQRLVRHFFGAKFFGVSRKKVAHDWHQKSAESAFDDW